MIEKICSCGHNEADHKIKDVEKMAVDLLERMIKCGDVRAHHSPDLVDPTGYEICGSVYMKADLLERIRHIMLERSHCVKKSFFKGCECNSFKVDNLRTLEVASERKARQIIC